MQWISIGHGFFYGYRAAGRDGVLKMEHMPDWPLLWKQLAEVQTAAMKKRKAGMATRGQKRRDHLTRG
jgi:hypothetical protein